MPDTQGLPWPEGDPAALRDIARAVRAVGGRLVGVGVRMTGAGGGVEWAGEAHDRFLDSLAASVQMLSATDDHFGDVGRALDELAGEVEAQQQRVLQLADSVRATRAAEREAAVAAEQAERSATAARAAAEAMPLDPGLRSMAANAQDEAATNGAAHDRAGMEASETWRFALQSANEAVSAVGAVDARTAAVLDEAPPNPTTVTLPTYGGRAFGSAGAEVFALVPGASSYAAALAAAQRRTQPVQPVNPPAGGPSPGGSGWDGTIAPIPSFGGSGGSTTRPTSPEEVGRLGEPNMSVEAHRGPTAAINVPADRRPPIIFTPPAPPPPLIIDGPGSLPTGPRPGQVIDGPGSLPEGPKPGQVIDGPNAPARRREREIIAATPKHPVPPLLERPDDAKGKTPDDVVAELPPHWQRKPSRRGNGDVYSDPERHGVQVRIMPGNPNDPQVIKQGPYLIVSYKGVAHRIPLADNPTLP